MVVSDDNHKLKLAIEEYKTEQDAKKIVQIYNDRHGELTSLFDPANNEKLKELELTSTFHYLLKQNESELTKKELLNRICAEERGVPLEYVQSSEILYKKLANLMLGKESKYPKDSFHFLTSESTKLAKLIKDYAQVRHDAFITTLIL